MNKVLSPIFSAFKESRLKVFYILLMSIRFSKGNKYYQSFFKFVFPAKFMVHDQENRAALTSKTKRK